MQNIFEFSDVIGNPRNSLSDHPLVEFCTRHNKRFDAWFNDKFLKYPYDKIDHDDLRALAESLSRVTIELVNDFLDREDYTSLFELLKLATIGSSVEPITDAEPTFSTIAKALRSLGLSLQVS